MEKDSKNKRGSIKIAFMGIKGLPAKGGAERVAEAIIERLSRKKSDYSIYVYTMKGYAGNYIPAQNLCLIEIPVLSGKHSRPFLFGLLSALHAAFIGHFDLVHLHNVEMSFVLPILRLRYKAIATSHGVHIRPKWSPIVRILWRLMDYPFLWLSNVATCVSLPHKQFYMNRYHRKVIYIPNGAELLSIDLKSTKKLLVEYNIRPKSFILFAAGRIIPSKGCHLLLQAFGELQTEYPLVIVGDYSDVPHYISLIKSFADKRIFFLSFISEKKELFGLISQAKLFVFPSLMEASSMMLLEVASLGIPILSSDIPENVALLSGHAVFFQSGNVIDLKSKLQSCLANIEHLERQAIDTKVWIRERYNWDNICAMYEDIYQKITLGILKDRLV